MKTINWIFLVAGTVIMIYVMTVTGKPLKMPATPLGILNLEFAYNASKTGAVMAAWSIPGLNGIDTVQAAIRNTWLDFVFLFFYSLFLFYCCKTIAESFSGFIQKTGKVLALGALYAGLLDIAENAGMLFTLNGFSSNGIALCTTICSVIKWILALSALAYVVLLGPLFILRKITKP